MAVKESILDRVAAGDPRAVTDVLDRYGALVWSLLRARLRNAVAAEDAAQEIFIEIWKSAGRFDPQAASEVVFVAKIARRCVVDRLRALGRPPATAPLHPELPLFTALEPSDQYAGVADVVLAAHAMTELDDTQREIVRLGVVQGLPLVEIAAAAGKPLGAVRTQLRRGLIKVRELMSGGVRSAGESVALERIDELLVQRVTEGLSAAETVELDQLLRHHPGIDGDALERSAAALAVAMLERVEALPGDVRTRARAAAATVLPARSASAAAVQPSWSWLIAAAALALAAIGWWPSPAEPGAEQRAALLAAGVAPLAWNAAEDPAVAGASGDVVWDARTQQGVMRFLALAANEPTRFQYQLWIFDAARDERFPVDGGVFDIPAGSGEVLIPIRAKLPVSNAVLFAVTVEAPGGVVVSSRERTVLQAELR